MLNENRASSNQIEELLKEENRLHYSGGALMKEDSKVYGLEERPYDISEKLFRVCCTIEGTVTERIFGEEVEVPFMTMFDYRLN